MFKEIEVAIDKINMKQETIRISGFLNYMNRTFINKSI